MGNTTTSMFHSGTVEAVAGTIVTSVVSLVTSGYEMHEAIDETLYSLNQEVIEIQSAIEEARGRRITNQKLLVWLAMLIDASYCGEYYLRTFKSKSSHPPMIESTEGTSNLLIDPTSRPAKRRRTIRTEVMKTLKGHLECRELHDVLKRVKSVHVSKFLKMVYKYDRPERPMKSYLYMDHTWLIDRGMQREQVMKFLFEPSMAGENNVDILPIVGEDGVGKTTLALHCFYDPKVQTHFSLKIYIDIPFTPYCDYCRPSRIFELILSQCNNTQITNYDDENTLLAMLKQNLCSKKFLIVIDNVWSIDSKVWKLLLGCLRCGKEGSKVIFTRDLYNYNDNKSFGKTPETVRPIMLDGFCEEQYMLFFREHAFGSTDPEDHPELTKIGVEIAKKMNGSIWGAKIIGELLRDNLNAPFWSTFLQDRFLSSLFLRQKDTTPVEETISHLLLPKGLKILY